MQERIEKILPYLEETGTTHAALSEWTNLSSEIISQILNGRYTDVEESNLVKLEQAVQMSVHMQERTDKILQYLEETKTTQATLSKWANLSPPVISQILKGTYVGVVESNLVKLEQAIQNQKDKKAVSFKAPEFITTTLVRKMENALYDVQNWAVPIMMVLYGASGIGKTETLTNYIDNNPTAVLIEVSPEFTFGSLLQEIAQEIGVTHHGKHYEIRKRIVSKLKGSNRMLIIDEAEYLIQHITKDALQELLFNCVTTIQTSRILHNLYVSQSLSVLYLRGVFCA